MLTLQEAARLRVASEFERASLRQRALLRRAVLQELLRCTDAELAGLQRDGMSGAEAVQGGLGYDHGSLLLCGDVLAYALWISLARLECAWHAASQYPGSTVQAATPAWIDCLAR